MGILPKEWGWWSRVSYPDGKCRPPMGTIFFWVGTKTMQNTRTTLKVLRSHFLYGAKTNWDANPELLHIIGGCFFRVYWKFPLPMVFKLFAPFFGVWNESCFSLEDLKFFMFRCDQPPGKFREMVEILIIGQISWRPNRPVVTPNGFSKGKCPSFTLKN